MNILLHKTWNRAISIMLVVSTVISLFSGAGSTGGIAEIYTGKGYGCNSNHIIDGEDRNYDEEPDDHNEIYKSILNELDTPLDIYNHIRKNITSVPGIKGSRTVEEILEDKEATASESALLLGSLLRDKGYKVKYVWGKAVLDEKQIMDLTNTDKLSDAEAVLDSYGINYTKTDYKDKKSEQQESALFEVSHIWVKAYIPITDYRCAGNNAGDHEWVELDTYIKNSDIEAVKTIGLIPLSLQYETKGLENGKEPEEYEDIPEDIYIVKDDVTEDVTEDDTTEDDTTEDNTTEDNTDDLTSDEKTDEESSEDDSTEKTEEVSKEDTSEETTESTTEEVVDGFFKTFDTKDDFIYGDEVITSADDSIDATEMYYLKMIDRNPYAVSGDA